MMSGEFTIKLDTIEKVKDFVNTISRFPCDADIVSSNSRYIIDAKSIMGVLSLDLSKNLKLIIHAENNKEINDIQSAIKVFFV